MADLKAFDDLLDRTITSSRLSGSKVKELESMAIKLVANDHHIVTALLRLNSSLPPASTSRISALYVFDAIARAAKADVNRGNGRAVSTERGKGTQAGLLAKMEGVVESVVDGMVDNGKGGVWTEGRDKTRKIVEIWRKGNTFPEPCISLLASRIASASTPTGRGSPTRSPRLPPLDGRGAGSSKQARSTTPPYPPPAHLLARFGRAGTSGSPGGSRSPAPTAAATQPGQLPPEIRALLGVKTKEDEKAETSSAIDAVLANVRKLPVSASATPPIAPVPGHATTPSLDPAQLAALANLASLTGGTAAGPSTALPPAAAPPSYGNDRFSNGGRDDRYQNGSNSGNYRSRSRSPQRERGGWRDDPRGRDPRDRQDDRGYGRDDRRETYDRREGDRGGDRRDPRHRDSVDFANRSGLPAKPAGLPARPSPSTLPAGLPSRPQVSADPRRLAPPHEAAPPMPAPPAAGGGAGLAGFDMSSFNPASPESWAALGVAWKASTGREPNQLELMQFLATGQVPDANMGNGGGQQGMGMGMMGMGAMPMGGMMGFPMGMGGQANGH